MQDPQTLQLLSLILIEWVSSHNIHHADIISSLRSKLRKCIIQQLRIGPRIRKSFAKWSAQHLFQGVSKVFKVFKPPKRLSTRPSWFLSNGPPRHRPSGVSTGASYPKVRCKGARTAHSELQIHPTLSRVGLATCRSMQHMRSTANCRRTHIAY